MGKIKFLIPLLIFFLIGCAKEDIVTYKDSTWTKNITEEAKDKQEGFIQATVERVKDGDTIVLNDGQTVRLIGVDTPETVKPNAPIEPYGEEASAFTKQILTGKVIYLEKDVSETDQYGRLLRYVYLEDGTLLNEYLIKEGYGKMVTYPPDVKHVELFKEAQIYAMENNKGLWSLENTNFAESDLFINENGEGLIKGNPNSMIYHMPNGMHYNQVKSPIYFKTEKDAIDAGYRKSKN